MSARRLAPVLTPIIRAAIQTYFLKREEKLAEKQAQARVSALDDVSLESNGDPTPPSRPSTTETRRRLDQHINEETCGTCRMALEEIKHLPQDERREGLAVYEDEYQPTKEAFEAGDTDQDELQDATRTLLNAAGL